MPPEQPNQPYQQPVYTGGPASPYVAPSTPGGKNKWLLIGAFIVVAVLAVAGVLLLTHKSKTPQAATSTTTSSSLHFPAASSLTASSVAKLNKGELFWDYLMNAEEQQKVVIINDNVSHDLTGVDPDERYVTKTGFNYQTKKVVWARDSYSSTGSVGDKARCLNGKEWIQGERGPGQYGPWAAADDNIDCQLSSLTSTVSGGFNPGGLTAEQAAAFTGVLRAQKGLMTVKSLELVTHRGKSYLHFSATLTPILQDNAPPYVGLDWLDIAFTETKLQEDSLPYGYLTGEGDGMALDYYIDPSTNLPAYSEVGLTPYINDNGTPKKQQFQNTQKASYQFGIDSFDASTSNSKFISVDW